jgi:hypothetical protein
MSEVSRCGERLVSELIVAVSRIGMLPQGFLGAYSPERAFPRELGTAERLRAQAGFPNGFNVDLQYPTGFTR